MLQSKELDIKNTLSPCGCCKPPENDDLSAIDFSFSLSILFSLLFFLLLDLSFSLSLSLLSVTLLLSFSFSFSLFFSPSLMLDTDFSNDLSWKGKLNLHNTISFILSVCSLILRINLFSSLKLKTFIVLSSELLIKNILFL